MAFWYCLPWAAWPSGLMGRLQACRRREGEELAWNYSGSCTVPLLPQTLSRSQDPPVVRAEPPGQTQLLTFLKEPWQWRWQQQ